MSDSIQSSVRVKPAQNEFAAAFAEVSASSVGGAPFLIAYGITFAFTAVLSYLLPREITALVAMFQGAAALPVAFWLERRMGHGRMSAENPLKSLSGQLAVSQALAIPLLIVAYSVEPGLIPLSLASLGGMHLLPYAWLHRTKIYIFLAVVLAVGALGLQFMFGAAAFHYILFGIAVTYGLTAVLVYGHARRLFVAQI
ncbi:MAG: hypothetical protein KDE51_19935 [Anaerolineales bacterium]|nr:hypothetical protein [Anaerolineales bacterium]